MTSQPRCGLYVRQSSTDGTESASLADQQESLVALAERNGWIVAGVYTDPDAPADALERRTRWVDLLADAEDGALDVVAAYDTSRLWRSVELKIVTCRQLAAAGVATVATLGGSWATDDRDDPESGLVSNLLAAVAQFDNRLRALKVRRARLRAAKAGEPHANGARPWGYLDTHRSGHEPGEAEVIRDTAKRVLAGEPLHVVAAWLNDGGHTTTTGRAWTGSLVRQALMSPGLAGLRGHGRDQRGRYATLYEGTWDGVLERDVWDQVQDAFATRTPTPYHRQLLSGLARCGRCKAPLTASRDRHGARLYRCKSTENSPERCSRLVVLSEPLETEVCDQVLASIDPALVARLLAASAGTDSDTADASATLRDLAARRVRIGAELADGLDMTAGRAALRRLDELEDGARKRLRRAHRGSDDLLAEVAVDPAAWWEANPERRRKLLDAVLTEVRVAPVEGRGRAFDPDRVDPRWRA